MARPADRLRCGPATARVRRTVTRLLRELAIIRFDHVALRELAGLDYAPVDFFYLAHNGIHSDRLLRLARVLDDHHEAAAFWYIQRCIPGPLSAALAPTGINLAGIKQFWARFQQIRDKVFVHIDKAAVFDPEAVYRAAGISGQEILQVTEALWAALNDLYRQLHGEVFTAPADYSGDDVAVLHRHYVEWRWPGSA